MSDKIGLFTGSFDPVTLGHVELIERASRLFDRLYVGLFYNKDKQGQFSLEQRLLFLKEALTHLDNVAVLAVSNRLAVHVAQEHGVTHLVRGLRNATDLEYEDNLAYFNHQLADQLDTIFLLSQGDRRYISSSRVRELIYFKADVRPYVPEVVALEVEKSYETSEKI